MFVHIPQSTNWMVDALNMLGSRFIIKGETWEPIIWSTCHGAPAGTILPSSVVIESFALEGYKEWYSGCHQLFGTQPTTNQSIKAHPRVISVKEMCSISEDLMECYYGVRPKEESPKAMRLAHESPYFHPLHDWPVCLGERGRSSSNFERLSAHPLSSIHLASLVRRRSSLGQDWSTFNPRTTGQSLERQRKC